MKLNRKMRRQMKKHLRPVNDGYRPEGGETAGPPPQGGSAAVPPKDESPIYEIGIPLGVLNIKAPGINFVCQCCGRNAMVITMEGAPVVIAPDLIRKIKAGIPAPIQCQCGTRHIVNKAEPPEKRLIDVVSPHFRLPKDLRVKG